MAVDTILLDAGGTKKAGIIRRAKPKAYPSVTNSVQTLRSNSGLLKSWMITNRSDAAAFVQLFDKTGSVVLGTTAPDWIIGLAAGAASNVSMPDGLEFTNAIKFAATTTPNGNTAPSTGLSVSFGHADS